MARTVTLPLLGIQELAAHLGVTPMDVKNWRRRDRLPDPVAELAYGPIWTAAQFPAKLRRELVGNGRPAKPTTSPRSGRPRKTSRAKAASSRKKRN